MQFLALAVRTVKMQSGESVMGNNRSLRQLQVKPQTSHHLLTLVTHCKLQSDSSFTGNTENTSFLVTSKLQTLQVFYLIGRSMKELLMIN